MWYNILERKEKVMARELKTIDISSVPELLRIVEEAREAREPRLLRRGREDLAILRPVKTASKRRKRTKTEADYAAFLSSAGSWKDVDTDRLIRDIYESRRMSSRPPVEL